MYESTSSLDTSPSQPPSSSSGVHALTLRLSWVCLAKPSLSSLVNGVRMGAGGVGRRWQGSTKRKGVKLVCLPEFHDLLVCRPIAHRAGQHPAGLGVDLDQGLRPSIFN